MRILMALVLMAMTLVPALAQDDAKPWQATVNGQIEAMRAQDGATALTFAGAAFRMQFDGQPEAFLAAIIASGYQPIADSRSHSFGDSNEISDTVVTQVVRLIGADQNLYEALYQLVDEPDEGWRVAGVVLRKQAGLSV